jgi:NTP pyrophosphatase (non-canonical NTP hydrolase)
VSLSEAQRRVHQWISGFEEGYFHPLTNLARLTEEVGELAREINHRFGEKTKKKEEPEGDLAMEMADILFVLICMANREGIDLQAAFDRMMEKVETRDRGRWTRKAGPADRRTSLPRAERGGGPAEEG